MITDSTIPIDTGHVSLSVMSALSFYPGTFNQSWRTISIHGNYYTYFMPVKLTYGVAKDMEVYIVAPFINYWVNHADQSISVNGNTSANYTGIGDLTLMGKYLLCSEGDIMPAVSAVAGFGSIPTGHASHLNPRFMGVDAIGTGALTLSTGVNLYKWVKPFLVYSNIWINSPINLYKATASASPQPVRSREYILFNLAAEFPLSSKFVLLLEMYSNWTWTNLCPFRRPRVTKPRKPFWASCRGLNFWPRINCPWRLGPRLTWWEKMASRNIPPCSWQPMPFNSRLATQAEEI